MAITTGIAAFLGSPNTAPPLPVDGLGYQSSPLAATRSRPAAQVQSSGQGLDTAVQANVLPLSAIAGGVRDGLQSSRRDANAQLQGLAATAATAAALSHIFGPPGDGLAARLEELTQALIGLANQTDGDPTANGRTADGQAAAVRAMDRLTQGLRATTGQLQELRSQADGRLQGTLTETNAVLQKLAQTNDRIAIRASGGSADTASLADRDSLLDSLSTSLDLATFGHPDGTAAVFTKGGTPLVSGGAAATLVCGSNASSSADVPAGAEAGPAGTPAPTEDQCVSANGVDLSNQLSGGRIHALLQTTNTQVPAAQAQIDTLAQTLHARVNLISNRALAGDAARSAYTGSRRFAAPAKERLGLASGDTMVSLRDASGAVQAEASLGLMVRQYRQNAGLPPANAWPAPQVAAALNQWLSTRLGQTGQDVATIDDQGRLAIRLPAGASLGFRDQQTGVYQSAAVADPGKPLRLRGTLAFTDATGNGISTAEAVPSLDIVPTDSLNDIAAKLNALGGLTASLVEATSGTALRVTSTTASGLILQPDGSGDTVVSGLALRPAADQPAEDAAVQYLADNQAGSFTSRGMHSADAALGLAGVLTVNDGAATTAIPVDPACSLQSLAAKISGELAGSVISAAIVGVGNQFALKLSAPPGKQFLLDGPTDALQTAPGSGFSAAGGTLQVKFDGTAVGSLSIAPGSNLDEIAAALNDPAGPFSGKGIQASVGQAGGNRYLQVADLGGRLINIDGSATGTGDGKLDFRPNPRDAMGLLPQPDLVVSGFANFAGLNDLLVANPADAFDAKAPTGIFTSTAVPGTAGALAVNPELVERPASLDPTTARAVADVLAAPTPVAAAGGLARGTTSLAQYAGTIAIVAQSAAAAASDQLAFQRALMDGLDAQRHGLTGLDLDDRLANLATFQRAYQDSASIVSTMPQLIDRLGRATA